MKALYEYSVDTVGEVKSLVNNAGITHMAELHETTEEEWDSHFDLIVKAIYYVSIYFIPHMIENQEGSIVNTASISGFTGDYNMAAYNAAKGAVVNLTRGMALDYGKHNIRVNNVAPYATNTPLFQKNPEETIEAFEEANPMGRLAEPEDIGRAMQFLASDEAEFINGATLPVSGGIENYSGQPIQY